MLYRIFELGYCCCLLMLLLQTYFFPDCPPPVPVLAIVLGVIAGIVILGLLLLLVWKALTVIHDRREVAKFENERLMAKWDTVIFCLLRISVFFAYFFYVFFSKSSNRIYLFMYFFFIELYYRTKIQSINKQLQRLRIPCTVVIWQKTGGSKDRFLIIIFRVVKIFNF